MELKTLLQMIIGIATLFVLMGIVRVIIK